MSIMCPGDQLCVTSPQPTPMVLFESTSHATPSLPASSNGTPRAGSSSNPRLSEWASNYCIPWANGTSSFRKSLELKARPKKAELLKFVRAVGDNVMEEVGDNPGAGNLSVIASRIVSRHSSSLADYIDGLGVISDGSQTFKSRLIRYVENERRKKKAPLRRKLLDDGTEQAVAEGNKAGEESSPLNSKRKAKSMSSLSKDSYGCINWQPSDFSKGETEDSQELKRLWLIAEYRKSVSDRDSRKVIKTMAETYASQRVFINVEKAPISVVREKWPFLLTYPELLAHFELLVNVSLNAKMDEYLAQQAGILFRYAESSVSDLIQKLVRMLNEASIFNKNDIPKTVGSVLLLPLLLKEEEGMLFKCYDVSDIRLF